MFLGITATGERLKSQMGFNFFLTMSLGFFSYLNVMCRYNKYFLKVVSELNLRYCSNCPCKANDLSTIFLP